YQAPAQEQPDKYEGLMRVGDDLLKKGAEKLNAGEVARQAGDFAGSLPLYESAIALDEEALQNFKSAEGYAPQDRQKHAVFFQGVALAEKGKAIVFYNRASISLKRGGPHAFCAALHEIRRSMTLGMTSKLNSSLYFELGLSLVGAGEYEQGIQALDEFLSSHQGNSLQ